MDPGYCYGEYHPYFDPEYDSFTERINPPSCLARLLVLPPPTGSLWKPGRHVWMQMPAPGRQSGMACTSICPHEKKIKNRYWIFFLVGWGGTPIIASELCFSFFHGCGGMKVDSANKHGILLEMVQVLTDLDLVISKSYISSDGSWFMDVFHVTDQFGRKVSDGSLISFIEQSLGSGRARSRAQPVKTCLGRMVVPKDAMVSFPSSEYTAIELTGEDRPGLLSELSAVLVEHDCCVVSAQAWTYDCRAACIVYIGEQPSGGAIKGKRLAKLEERLHHVVAAHHGPCERWQVRVLAAVSAANQIHTERRLHQMMHEDMRIEEDEAEEGATARNHRTTAREMTTNVSIDGCMEKGYSVVSIRSRDRPKLLFDTVCTLTDMNYVVFHATVSSHGSIAVQEYFIRRMDGHPLDSEAERRKVIRCLVAAIERRVSRGLRLNVCTHNRLGLLSDVTRVFREHGLSVTGVDIGARGEKSDTAVGTFYVSETSGAEVDHKTVESVKEHIGGRVAVEVDSSPPGWPLQGRNMDPGMGRLGPNAGERARFSLANLFWSRLERLSHNLGSIKS